MRPRASAPADPDERTSPLASERASDIRSTASRAAALDVLQAVLRHGRALDDVLVEHKMLATLASRDRAFVRLLVATTLRRLGQIDALIDGALETSLPERAVAARDLLRLGVTQIVFLATPVYAAVNETVEQCNAIGHRRMSGLVNAVMRRLSREGRMLAAEQDAPTLDTPDWLMRSWSTAYGPALARAIATAHLDEPPLDFTCVAETGKWASALEAQVLPTGSLRRFTGGAVAELPGYQEGAWWVQDAAAALPALLFGDVEGRRIVDLCAAPGGKTAQLARDGAQVIAVDRSTTRLHRLAENLKRLGLEAETVASDATLWRPAAPVDGVLVDAPCSATGTIRRHPDIAHLKSPADIGRLVPLQARLLNAAIEMTRPGGLIVYCVCSLEAEEGPAQIAALIERGAPVERVPVAADEVGGSPEFVTPEGDIRTLPCHWPKLGGLDGFYAARLRRL
ncbi:MAG: RsmB/NOP family class I SAM-dependent RNA methyltransferase [Candidatus Eiseniibacteriota bacterium]